jgi:polar amino acid transport system substrate-binding protein
MKTSFLVVGLTLIMASLSAQSTLTVKADSWFPFNDDPASAKPGYVVELLRLIFEPQGIKIDYKLTPWNRSLAEVENGQADCVIGALKTDAPNFVFPLDSAGITKNVFFTNKDKKWKYTGIDSLSEIKLGVIADYSYSDALDAYIKKYKGDAKKITVLTGDTALDQGIRMLEKGRVDAIVEDESVCASKLGLMKLDPAHFPQVGFDGKAEMIYVAFSPHESKKATSAQHAARWDDGIKKLRASGELAKLLTKYGLKDWAL